MEILTEQKTSVSFNVAKPKVVPPSLYDVIIFNDDYTPMEFVVQLIQRVFGKDESTATQIMLHIHNQGEGVCGQYPKDIAETKAAQSVSIAQENGYPLLAEARPKR
jgi:ATP-dependent Clp protease adaptor protein ClpS